ncbi:hypothetical protein GTW98_17105 [Streptomyces sp. SID8375]|uniref:hypothetical protein n=1 Tax=unclassified Streptomyces TaxID=2593676 RepID=UPI00036C5B80|nr:hypothetical protein [Streptomyces sp. FxanaC1]MYX08499.1 hypothetical protein [Streptomyces sp. SID8375]
MTRHRKSSDPKRGEGQSMHKGTEQHGWSPDVDQTEQQKNESAHRSFHPEEYAPEKDRAEKGRGKESGGQEKVPPASEVKSETAAGERRAAETDEKGMRDMGPKGPSRRPSGGRDAEAHTGVDPQNP